MILEFKTRRTRFGDRKYLLIVTDSKRFTRQCSRMITDGIEIKTKDYNRLIAQCKSEGYQEYIRV